MKQQLKSKLYTWRRRKLALNFHKPKLSPTGKNKNLNQQFR
jgi:hypothetical protein